MTNSQVCVDSNLVLKLILLEHDSYQAHAIWDEWSQRRTEIVAPPLIWYEITSVLRTRVYRGIFTVVEGLQALESAQGLGIVNMSPPGLHQKAYGIATDMGLPAAYDSHYLALAEYLGCEFWTADRRLHRSVRNSLAWVRLLQEAE